MVNQYLRHDLGYKIYVIRRNQIYLTCSSVSTDTTIIIKNYMQNERFTFSSKITIKWNLTKSYARRSQSGKYKTE